MTARIGFVLLTHQHPAQIIRVARRLVRSFDAPPIVCHHDFSQTPLDVTAFPKEVRFVRPHVRTRWGDFSLVDATLAALRLLHATASPEWVAIVSGADYPLRPGDRVVADLERGGSDVYMRYSRVDPYRVADADEAPGPLGYEVGEGHVNARKVFRRYYQQMVRVPLPARLSGTRGLVLRTKRRWLVARLAPYNEAFRCYAGSQWFTLRRTAVDYILRWHDDHSWLAEYLRIRPVPDESYFHTVLGNAPELRISNRYFRYIDWSLGGPNPKVLGVADLERMASSDAHFARKFLPDDPVLDRLDELLDSSSR